MTLDTMASFDSHVEMMRDAVEQVDMAARNLDKKLGDVEVDMGEIVEGMQAITEEWKEWK